MWLAPVSLAGVEGEEDRRPCPMVAGEAWALRTCRVAEGEVEEGRHGQRAEVGEAAAERFRLCLLHCTVV
jgi:hypothetical protein